MTTTDGFSKTYRFEVVLEDGSKFHIGAMAKGADDKSRNGNKLFHYKQMQISQKEDARYSR